MPASLIFQGVGIVIKWGVQSVLDFLRGISFTLDFRLESARFAERNHLGLRG